MRKVVIHIDMGILINKLHPPFYPDKITQTHTSLIETHAYLVGRDRRSHTIEHIMQPSVLPTYHGAVLTMGNLKL